MPNNLEENKKFQIMNDWSVWLFIVLHFKSLSNGIKINALFLNKDNLNSQKMAKVTKPKYFMGNSSKNSTFYFPFSDFIFHQ